MPSKDLVDDVLTGLNAYAQLYGLPDSAEQVQGIIGTLVNLKTQAGATTLKTAEIEQVIRQVLDGFHPQAITSELVDQSKQALAEQAHQWQGQIQHQVKETLNAYVQQYAPGMSLEAIRDVAIAAMPLIDNGPVTKAEVNGLISQVISSFNLEAALSSKIHPAYVDMAKTLAIALSQKPMEQAVSETVTAYVEKFAPTVENIGENLISNALSAVLKNKVEFGIDTDLNLANKQLLIQQISFKLNIMKQSPLPSKTAQQLAAELNTEIERFKKERESQVGTGNSAGGLVSNDGLSVSGWTSTRSSAPPQQWPAAFEPKPDKPSDET